MGIRAHRLWAGPRFIKEADGGDSKSRRVTKRDDVAMTEGPL